MRVLLSSLFLICSIVSFGQADTPYLSKSTRGNINTLDSAVGMVTSGTGFGNKVYSDTTAANLNKNLRSYTGAQIYTLNPAAMWVRTAIPRRWVQIGTGASNNCFSNPPRITWDSLLVFSGTSGTYCISNKEYSYNGGYVTLSAAHPSLPRIDVIAVDTLSQLVVITGVAAATPAVPQINPLSQYYLTNVSVPAGATTPSGVINTTVWDENLGLPNEWAGSAAGLTVNFGNTSNPYHFSIAADVGAFDNSDLILFSGASYNLNDYNSISFWVRLKSALVNPASINVGLSSNGAAATSSLELTSLHGFNSSLVGVYQKITVPISEFIFPVAVSTIDGLYLKMAGSNANGFYIDWITLNGGVQTSNSPYLTDVYASNDSLYKVKNGISTFWYKVTGGSSGVTYAQLDSAVGRKLDLAGTGASGAPGKITGDVEFGSDDYRKIFSNIGDSEREILFPSDEEITYITTKNINTGEKSFILINSQNTQIRNEDLNKSYESQVLFGIEKVVIGSNNPTYKGLEASNYFPNKDPNTYSQMKDIADSMEVVRDSLAAIRGDIGGGGGSAKYSTSEYGISIDSATANLYKIRVDTSISGLSGKYVRMADAIPYTLNNPSNNTLLKYDSLNNRFVNFKLTGVYPVAYNETTGEISSSGSVDTSYLPIVASGLSTGALPNNKGLSLKNHAPATSLVTQFAPMLIFKGSKWTGSASLPVFWRMITYGSGGSQGYFQMQSSNDSTTWTNGIQFNETSGLTAFGTITAAGYAGNAQYGNNSMNIRSDGTALFGAIGATDTRAQLELRTSTKGLLHARGTTAISGRVSTLPNAGSITTGGSGYTNGSFPNISMSGGNGTGLTVTIIITGGAVTGVNTLANGYGYRVGDVLSYNGTGGTGFTYTITSLVGTGLSGLQNYNTDRNILYTWNGVGNQGDLQVISTATYTLLPGTDVIFTGANSTFTLPTVSASYVGRANGFKIKNRGSGTITVNSATGSQIYTTSAQANISIVAGAACEILPDGTYFNILYNN